MTQIVESGLGVQLGAERSETPVEWDVELLDFSYALKIARPSADAD
jgi:hypothetical protein